MVSGLNWFCDIRGWTMVSYLVRQYLVSSEKNSLKEACHSLRFGNIQLLWVWGPVGRGFERFTVCTERFSRPTADIFCTSSLDVRVPTRPSSVFFCYKKPGSLEFTSVVNTLKVSLSQALVDYYPLAGQVVANSAGEPELLCNNGGLDFVEAFGDLSLRVLDLHQPDETVQGKLMPEKKRGEAAIQVTI
ncbi:hypothetical protein MLD38_035771 [Melastoma candidum]|uniref:Uncharacterized protein n=1 Tax=Melastoma candidum TaxID=119954 RepID=A0ACB9LJG4_9MYRT|nr:hypothetical protein MLD38_035771 [Melastoma candidum]